jgi:hypothetical protein
VGAKWSSLAMMGHRPFGTWKNIVVWARTLKNGVLRTRWRALFCRPTSQNNIFGVYGVTGPITHMVTPRVMGAHKMISVIFNNINNNCFRGVEYTSHKLAPFNQSAATPFLFLFSFFFFLFFFFRFLVLKGLPTQPTVNSFTQPVVNLAYTINENQQKSGETTYYNFCITDLSPFPAI